MDIDPTSAAGTSVCQETTYYFCSAGCKRDFDEDPEGVLKAEAEYDHSQPIEEMMAPSSESATVSSPARRPWWRFWG
jgi:YHS domain-containing protein